MRAIRFARFPSVEQVQRLLHRRDLRPRPRRIAAHAIRRPATCPTAIRPWASSAVAPRAIRPAPWGGNANLSTTKGDITLTASNIAATGDVTMHAAGDLTIQSGQDTAGNANVSDNKAIGTVVISDTERFSGYHTEKHRDDNATVTQVASSVGSLGGNVNLSAGGTYTQSASNVVAAKDVDVTAASIQLLTANDSHAASSQDDTLKIGAFARVKSPLIDLINNVDAARNSDGRLSAMQGMAAAANGYQAASAISSMAGGAGSGALVSVEAGVGYATSTEKYKAGSQTAQGSTISGGGNVSLTSTSGDLHVAQGNLKAGDTLSLDAARDLVLEAGKSSGSEQSKGSNAGLEVGVGASVGAQTGVYAYAQASVGSHSSNADSATWKNTELAAQNISLTSKGDTTLRGAVAKADRIDVQTGGDLTIESLQDTSNIQSKESGYGGRIQVSFGTAWDASGYASTANANGNSSGVTEQLGLFAGKGGYHVDAGNVNLVGGAIASTNADNSELTATSLTFSDLQNRMGYSASSGSLAGGFGSSGTPATDANGNPVAVSAGDQAKNIGSNIANGNYGAVNSGGLGGGLPMSQSGNDSTSTRATLTEGNITIGGKRTTAAETGINTNASKANEALATLPDVRKVLAEQQAMGAAAGTVLETSRQVAGDIAANAAQKTAEARDAYLKGLNSDEQEAFAKLDPTAQQNVLLSQSTAYSDAYATEKQWGTGGEYNRALQAVTTALVGGVSGQSGTQVASNALAPYAAQLIGQTFDANHGNDPNKSLQLLSHALLGAVLAEANGSSAAGGALTGGGGEAAAQYLTKTLYGADTKPSDLSEQDKQTILALSQAVGALVGGMTGGSVSDAAVGSTVARNAVENNWLKENENELKKVAQAECAAANKRSCEIVDAINELDKARDADYAINVDLANALMDEEGGKHTLQRFDQLMADYWAANGVDPEDAIFASTVSRTFPTNGQKLYSALDKIPGGVPGLGIFGMMLPGLLDQTGTTVAAWQDLYKPGQATNYFTGTSVSGTSAFDERFLGAATVAEIVLTSGASTAARTGLREVAEAAGSAEERSALRSLDGITESTVATDVSSGNAIDVSAGWTKNPLLEDSISRNGERIVVNQGRAPTCGHNSCGMVLDTLGKPVDVSNLIEKIPPSRDGISNYDVADLLKSMWCERQRV
ncbi:hemagglutinin repeat-containing protein [Xanthomonas sp. PPL568]|uniref:hemagglutinin repeat-containing protein n=1 Tax=Xanthomonas indica TaxID=2912242 RepID=UPI001F576167|nr:hemagglutinin repeat-containing protein [Xanthomonas indica]MCI2245826.1 hemagglutinin repeat-containing protein [Xanthomonas indica]